MFFIALRFVQNCYYAFNSNFLKLFHTDEPSSCTFVCFFLSRNNCFDSHSVRSIEAAVQDNCSRHSHSYSSPVARFLFLSGHTSPELGIVLCYLPAPNPSAPFLKNGWIIDPWSLAEQTFKSYANHDFLLTQNFTYVRTPERERESLKESWCRYVMWTTFA